MTLEIIPIPCLSDNYAYLVVCTETGATAVVDPSEAEPVRAALKAHGRTPSAIWCTHHHPDHVGGVEELVDDLGGSLPVYGYVGETRIPRQTERVPHEGRFTFGHLTVQGLYVPAHTRGAMTFVVNGEAAFTGDTLFCAGCGRLMEGTAGEMHHALNTVLGALPDATRVYPGHEYAEKNLRFALTVEPENAPTQARAKDVIARRATGAWCVPSTLGLERATNPFLRVTTPSVQAFAHTRGVDPSDAVAVFATVRSARDVF